MTTANSILSVAASAQPHTGSLGLLQSWQGSVWLMDPDHVNAFLAHVAATNIAAVADIQIAEKRPTWQRQGRTAVVPVSGVLMKSVPSWVRFWGLDATGYDEIGAALSEALADDSIDTINLAVNSPGGQASGNQELADRIRAARTQKRVTATIEDLGASAAYWLAAQAEQVTANPNAFVGSIGVYIVYWDMTAMAEQMGIKVHLIRSGELKGMGVPGAAISDGQIAAMQENIDAIYEDFLAGVAAGRQRSAKDVRSWGTGRVWEAKAALELGLIDAIASGQNNSATSPQTKEIDMDTTPATTTPPAPQSPVSSADATPATPPVDHAAVESQRIGQLTEAFEKTDPAFALEAIKAGWSLTDAKAVRHDRLEAAEQLRRRNSQNKTDDEAVEPVAFVEASDGGGGDFMADAKKLAAERKIAITEAIKQLKAEDPASYERFRATEQRRALRVHGGKAAGRVA